MNVEIEQAIMDKLERSDGCWPISEMTAAQVLHAINAGNAQYEDLMRVSNFMPNFCKSRLCGGLKHYKVRLKLEAVGDGADSVTNR